MAGLPEHIAYTKVPNFIIEKRMAELKGSELKVALVICRKTYGFHKQLDGIALSQIKELSGLGKNTIIKALRNLVRQNIVKRYADVSPHRYGIIVSNHNGSLKEMPEQKPPNPYPTNQQIRSSINEPAEVQKMNPKVVQNLNPQKKHLKERERNTTSSSDFSVDTVLIAEYWNEVFNKPIDLSDVEMANHIKYSLAQFGIEKIKKAIFNRSRSSYYKENKPFLLDKPSAFFPYTDTIANDLLRKPEGIFTYDEKNDRIFKRLNTDADFEIMRELRDQQNRPKWQLKNLKI